MAKEEIVGVMDGCVPLRLIYETLNSVDISTRQSRSRLFKAAFDTCKLKEYEISYKLALEDAARYITNAMKISAKYHGLDFETTPVIKLRELLFKDYNDYYLKLTQFDTKHYFIERENKFVFTSIVVDYYKYMGAIDNGIASLRTMIKSVESKEEILNTPRYGEILREDYYSLSNEQQKLLNEGKDIFSKEVISLGIKKLSTFKSRLQRHFNHYFGKDSYFGPLNLLDIYSK